MNFFDIPPAYRRTPLKRGRGKLEIERGKLKIETAKNNTFFMVIWGFVCWYVSFVNFSLFGAVTAEESKKDREVEEGIGGSGMGLWLVIFP